MLIAYSFLFRDSGQEYNASQKSGGVVRGGVVVWFLVVKPRASQEPDRFSLVRTLCETHSKYDNQGHVRVSPIFAQGCNTR